MIPILYEKDEIAFASNGLARLRDTISCVVTEGRNDVYECDFEYPVNGLHYDLIECGRIIAVTHDETGDIQPFDIVSYSRPINGVVTFHCVHVSYRQSKMTVSGTNISSLAGALNLLTTAAPSNPFTYWTDMSSSAVFAAADGVPRSVRQMLGGTEGSILDCYGGEYEWDVWTVRLWSSRGQERDFTIRYGVNLTAYNEDVDYSGTYTACIPFWVGNDEQNEQLVVKGNMVSADAVPYDGRKACVPLDLSSKFQEAPTAQQLEDAATVILASKKTYLPTQTIEVDFIRLQDSSEYANYKELLYCKLCDSIKVVFPTYNTSGSFKIVKTEYDVLQERFNKMELGTLSMSFAEAVGDGGMSPSVSDVRMLEISTVAAQAAASAQNAADAANDILDDMQEAAYAAGTTLTEIYQDAADAAQAASDAQTSASNAQTAASNAQTAASNAQTSASNALTAAQNAETSASNALTAAQNAQGSADAALVSLSNVEDVVGVLEWITAHGTMTANGSTALDPSKVYFVRDNNGDYHVGSYYYSIVAEPKAEDRTSYYTLSIDESVQNYVATHVVVDAEGLWLIPDAGGNKVLIATGAGNTYTTAGTYIIGKVNGVDTVFAKFTTTGATMNATNSTQIAHLGYGTGTSQDGTSTAPFYSFGVRGDGVGQVEVYDPTKTYSVGDLTLYNSALYRCKTAITTPEAFNSSHWGVPIGNYSVVEGYGNVASDYSSHSEGWGNVSEGLCSHTEGMNTSAKERAHAEGSSTTASGYASHSEGESTRASGKCSHAQNIGTYASQEAQTALGKYNVADTTSAVIIGNGTASNARSNALTVDWNGNVNIASGASYRVNGAVVGIPYLTCDTAAATAAKTTTLVHGSFDASCLVAGAQALVKFTYANGVANPTLSVNGTTAKSIKRYGTTAVSTSAASSWNAGAVVLFVYDGTNWIVENWLNTTYSSMSEAEITAGTSTTARLITPARLKTAIETWAPIATTKTTFTPTSGSSYSSYGGCYYEKSANTVHVHIGVSGLTASTATDIYTLPTGYRPTSPIFAYGTSGSWNSIAYVEIRTDGVVNVRSVGNYCGADVSFMV